MASPLYNYGPPTTPPRGFYIYDKWRDEIINVPHKEDSSMAVTPEQIKIANDVHNYLQKEHQANVQWVSTTEVWKHVKPDSHWQSFVNILNALMRNGVLKRLGNYRYSWALNTESVWHSSNPFGKETPQYRKEFKPSKEDYKPQPQAPAEPSVDLTELRKEFDRKLRDLSNGYVHNQNAMVKTIELLQKDKEELEKKLQSQIEELARIAVSSVKEIKVTLPDQEVMEIEGPAHPMLEEAIQLATARVPIMLIGPTGSGKSYLAGQLADALNLDFSFTSCSAGMGEYHFLGRQLNIGERGRFEYVPAEYVTRYEKGGVMLLDEIDAADANTLLPINNSLANNVLALPNRVKKPYAQRHKDFVPMAAANTYGTGADRLFVGRNQLDEAFLDRWRMGQLYVDYDPGLEAALCPDKELRERLQKYRKNIENAKLRRVVSTRYLKDAYRMLKSGWSLERIDKALFGGWRPDEIQKAKGTF